MEKNIPHGNPGQKTETLFEGHTLAEINELLARVALLPRGPKREFTPLPGMEIYCMNTATTTTTTEPDNEAKYVESVKALLNDRSSDRLVGTLVDADLSAFQKASLFIEQCQNRKLDVIEALEGHELSFLQGERDFSRMMLDALRK